MKKIITYSLALLAWFAVIAQYWLMMENRIASYGETIIRFFSFFTILTNTLVAIHFTAISLSNNSKSNGFFNRPGTLTAVTIYITVVGLVYQVVLRHIWQPTGLQRIVDELLHTIIPLCTIIFWYVYEEKSMIKWSSLPYWLIYPFVYLVYILLRGSTSDFYPYPFINVTELGYQKVFINAAVMVAVFVGVSALFLGVGKRIKNKT
jgi:hypothetical protein